MISNKIDNFSNSNLKFLLFFFISDLIKLLNEDRRAINPFAILGLIDSPEHHKECSEIFVSDKFKDKELGIKKYPKKKTEKIKIGYFSPDFRNHPMLFLMMDTFKYHDKSKFEIYGFYFGENIDETDLIHKKIVNEVINIDELRILNLNNIDSATMK